MGECIGLYLSWLRQGDDLILCSTLQCHVEKSTFLTGKEATVFMKYSNSKPKIRFLSILLDPTQNKISLLGLF